MRNEEQKSVDLSLQPRKKEEEEEDKEMIMKASWLEVWFRYTASDEAERS